MTHISLTFVLAIYTIYTWNNNVDVVTLIYVIYGYSTNMAATNVYSFGMNMVATNIYSFQECHTVRKHSKCKYLTIMEAIMSINI